MILEDPLLALRRAIQIDPNNPVHFYNGQGEEVEIYESELFKIQEFYFSKDTMTNFKSKRGLGPFYGLEAVVFMFHQPAIREMPYTEYLQVARKGGVPVISLVDRKELISYVEASSDDVPYIDKNEPLPSAYSSIQEALSNDHMDTTMAEAQPLATHQQVPTNEPNTISTRTIHNRTTMFQSSKDFSFVLEIVKDFTKPTQKTSQEKPVSLIDSIKHANLSEQSPLGKVAGSAFKRKNYIPIIIVPSSPTAMINMFNAKDFLLESHYSSSSDAKNKNQNVKECQVLFEKTLPSGSKRTVQIIDNPSRLPLEDWNRVKAVFVQGQSWQFKEWKWENPVDLFQHVSGFFLQYDDAPIDKNVTSWNVHRLTINRSKRHLDSTASLNFWEKFEKFLDASI